MSDAAALPKRDEIPTQLIILADGFDTAGEAFAGSRPSSLAPIASGPFLAHVLSNASRFGFRDILLLHGSDPGELIPFAEPGRFGETTVRLVPTPPDGLGDAGALRHAAELLDETFLLVDGRTWFDINLLDLAICLDPARSVGCLALRWTSTRSRHAAVVLDGGEITGFGDSTAASSLVLGGVCALSRSVLDHINPGDGSLQTDVLPRLAERRLLQGRIYDRLFFDADAMTEPATAQAFQATLRRPALFLDRDGVLNEDTGYLFEIDEIEWIEAAAEAVKRANDLGFYVFVVTNQSGVARGYYGIDDVHAVHDHMAAVLRRHGAHVDRFEYCPYHPDGIVAPYAAHSPRRKPEPGMILDLLAAWPVDTAKSFLIGDSDTDLAAAAAAGIAGYRFGGGSLLHRLTGILAERGWRV